MVVAALLLGFHLLAGARDVVEPSVWIKAGSAASAAILHGEWWRTITAMTLHADLLHLFGNAVASLIFVGAVESRGWGPGWARR